MVTQVGMSLLRPRMRAPRLIFTAGYLPLTQNESISCNVVLRGKPAFSQQTLRIHPVLGCSANRRVVESRVASRPPDRRSHHEPHRAAWPNRADRLRPGAVLGA